MLAAIVISRVASSNRPALIKRCTPSIIMTHQLRLQRSHLIAAFSRIIATEKLLSPLKPNEPVRELKTAQTSAGQRSLQHPGLHSNVTIMSDNGANGIGSDRAKPASREHRPEIEGLPNEEIEREYLEAIKDLNGLQSNNQVIALAKYKKPETILPLFSKQLKLAGIDIDDLDRLNAVHISGTKGKGSTCAFLESILLSAGSVGGRARGLTVGSYNSPHLVHVTERIKINGKPIDKPLFTSYFRRVYDKLKQATEREQLSMPSYFAFLTILAFEIFLREQVDCAIIEVGIGGEYDPTNIIRRPVACAITTLDLDHTNILGNTIRSIAWTKAGIIKPGVPMFTVDHEQEEAVAMIQERARRKGSPVYICKPLLKSDQRHALGIQGPAQPINASVACQLALYLLNHLSLPSNLPKSDIGMSDGEVTVLETSFEALPKPFAQGLKHSSLPGRCQIIESKDAIFFLDGAHTKKSMENCLEWFMEASAKLHRNPTKFLMVNVIGERNKSEVLKPLLPHYQQFDKIIFTSNQVYPCTKSIEVIGSETFVRAQDSNYEKGLDNVKNNVRVWSDLVKDHGKSDETQLIIKRSIMESIHTVITSSTVSRSPGSSGEYQGRPHILATGSLHFVGAILDTIEKMGKCAKC